ncbi:MAG: J domain-containing protein [Iamia sp.]
MAEKPLTHYEVLGVPTGADPAEIRRAYVKLARRFHPDSHAGRSDAERNHADRRMRDVNAAWTTLSDPTRRRAYDDRMVRARPKDEGPPRPPGHGWRPRTDDDAWMDDFGSWREETDLLPPDRPGPRQPVRMLPVVIGVAALMSLLLGFVLSARPLLALAIALGGISLSLFVWFPFAELARSRDADPDR